MVGVEYPCIPSNVRNVGCLEMQVLHVKEKLQRHGFLGRIRGSKVE